MFYYIFQAIVRNQEEYSCMRATQIENIPKNVCQDVLPCKYRDDPKFSDGQV